MSGVAGGNRIQKKDVQRTYEKYEKEVLQKIPTYVKSTLTGSSKAQVKPDYGDLDLIALFKGEDKKAVKKDIIKVIEQLPDSVIVPFKSEKYKGRKYYNHGEMISLLYPIEGEPDQYIQVDNIIALSEDEQSFKNEFLDLSAQKQGLILGLVKTITQEEKPTSIFQRLGIKINPKLEPNQEFEFHLNSQQLVLRKVTLGDNYKELASETVWNSKDWNDLKTLLSNYNIEGTFEDLLKDLDSKIEHPRSKRRIKGMFSKSISVTSGEVGTEKGKLKQQAVDTVNKVLAESTKEVIGLYGGGFKPPHAVHFNIAKELSKQVDKLIIFIGKKPREGEKTIDAEDSLKIWKEYAKHINIPVDIQISNISPILDIYKVVEDSDKTSQDFVIAYNKTRDGNRYKSLETNREKYPNTNFLYIDNLSKKFGDLSGTTARQRLKDFDYWLPKEVSPKVIAGILNEYFLKTKFDSLLEDFIKDIPSEIGLVNLEETSSGTPIAPLGAIPSKDRAKMEEYLQYYQNLTPTGWNVSMKGMQIIITMDKYSQGPQSYNNDYDNTPNQPSMDVSEEVGSFDFIPYIGSIIEHMLDQGMNILPLPDIKLRKDQAEAADIFGKTAYYNPAGREVVLFTLNRHPKDVLRSFCHEMIHHIQNVEDRLGNITTTNTQEDDNLAKIEQEAHYLGSITFRHWEDKIKQQMDSAEKAPLQEDPD